MKTWKLVLLLVGTMIGWSTFHIYSEYALADLTALQLLFFREALAFAVLYPYMLIRDKKAPEAVKKIEKPDRKFIVIVGVSGYFLTSVLLIVGIGFAGSQYSSLINSLNPIFIAMFASFILREKVTPGKVAAILFGLAGTVIISGATPSREHLTGILIALCGGVTWSIGTVVCKRATRKYDPIRVTTYGFLVATVVSFAAAAGELIITGNPFTLSVRGAIAALVIGVIGTGIPHMMWNKAMSMADAGTCALAYPIMPITAAIFGVIFAHKNLGIGFYIGAVVIMAGLAIYALSTRKAARSRAK